MTTRIPNSWEEEEWSSRPSNTTTTRPNPAAPVFSPRILRPEIEQYALNGQPRSVFRPELKILKRTPDAPKAPAPVVTSEETDKSRQKRLREEKELRYQEVRARIMGESNTSSASSSPTPTTTKSSPAPTTTNTPKQQQKQGKRTPDAASTTPKSKSPTRTPNGGKHSTNNSRGTPPSRKSSPPRAGGAVTSFSLNGGQFATAPVISTGGRRYAQKVDGKLLESQLIATEGQDIIVDRDPEGGVYLSEGGLDWDDFSRDTAVLMQQQQQQQQHQQWTGYGGSASEYDYYSNGNATYANTNYGNGNGVYGNGNGVYGNGNGVYGNGNGGHGNGNASYANVSGNYGNGSGNGAYDYTQKFQSRQTQNPGIYGAATGEGRFVYDKPPPEKNVKVPGSGQTGVVQAMRAPKGPDADGSRGFKGRGAGPARNGVW